MEKLKQNYPGHTDAAHPEIFNTVPAFNEPLKPGQLSKKQLEKFFRDGYMIIEDFFTREELEPVKRDIESLVDTLAQRLYKAGKIQNLYESEDVYHRLIRINEEFPGANIVLMKYGILPQAMRNLWSNARALNLAEQILATEDIAGSPVWNLRAKLPNNEATTVPWHQDVGYFNQGANRLYQLTAWIPLLDTNPSNGCMQVIKSGQKSGKVADHQCCSGGTWYIMMIEDEIKNKLECDIEKDVVTCPVPYGGILLFNNLLPHRSLNNTSDVIRWSLDFRWQAANTDACFYGIKDSIRMRSSSEPDFEIDWSEFNSVDRHQQTLKTLELSSDEFDATVPGPWMKNWEISHPNVHTEALVGEGRESMGRDISAVVG